MLRISIIVAFLMISACSSQERADFQLAQKEISQQHYRTALSYLDRVIRRNSQSPYALEAAREAAKISFFETRDFNKTIEYSKFIVLNSKDEKERKEQQQNIAKIYFENIQDYKAATIEYGKLLQMPSSAQEEGFYKMAIARSQYYLNNFDQSQFEIESILKSTIDSNTRFQAFMLKGNILVAKKEFQSAIAVFKDLIQKYPLKSSEENIPLILAVSYEELLDYKSAIEALESHRAHYKPPEYIELRIKRLQERRKNAPGAKGFRK